MVLGDHELPVLHATHSLLFPGGPNYQEERLLRLLRPIPNVTPASRRSRKTLANMARMARPLRKQKSRIPSRNPRFTVVSG